MTEVSQNITMIDHTGKIIKNQLKLPYYGELDRPVILLDGQEEVIAVNEFTFIKKVKYIYKMLFHKKILAMYKPKEK